MPKRIYNISEEDLEDLMKNGLDFSSDEEDTPKKTSKNTKSKDTENKKVNFSTPPKTDEINEEPSNLDIKEDDEEKLNYSKNVDELDEEDDDESEEEVVIQKKVKKTKPKPVRKKKRKIVVIEESDSEDDDDESEPEPQHFSQRNYIVRDKKQKKQKKQSSIYDRRINEPTPQQTFQNNLMNMLR